MVLERLTCMRRHGMTGEELRRSRQARSAPPGRARGRRLPPAAGLGSHLGEVVHLVNDVVASELPTRTCG